MPVQNLRSTTGLETAGFDGASAKPETDTILMNAELFSRARIDSNRIRVTGEDVGRSRQAAGQLARAAIRNRQDVVHVAAAAIQARVQSQDLPTQQLAASAEMQAQRYMGHVTLQDARWLDAFKEQCVQEAALNSRIEQLVKQYPELAGRL